MSAPWTPRRLLLVSLLAHGVLLLCAVRHRYVWGGGLAPALHVAEALGLATFAVAAGWAYLRALRQAEALDARFLWRVGLLLTLVAALAPPFLSNDFWDYLARGRVEELGSNPYTTSVASLREAPGMVDYARNADWTGWVMPYGPLAAVLQRVCATPDSLLLGAALWKALASAAHVATAWLVRRTLARTAGDAAGKRGLVLWLWNPWLLLECCGSAHNDVFVALLLAACGLGLAQADFVRSTVAYGFAMLVKHGSPPLLPLLAGAAWRQRRLPAFALGSVLVVAVVAFAWHRYWNVEGGLDWISAQGSVARGSVRAFAGQWLGGWASTAVAIAGLAIVVAVLARGIARATDARAFGRCGVLAMVPFVLLCVPNFAPWYHLWWLPLLGVARVPAFDRALVLVAFTGPLAYVPLAATHEFGTVHEAWGLCVAGLLPAAVALGVRRASQDATT